MNLQGLMARPGATRLTMFLGRSMPPRMGHGLARLLSGVVCRTRPSVYWVVRANLSQVLGTDRGPALEAKTREVFYFSIRNYYDLYHSLHLPREKLNGAVDFPPAMREIARSVIDRQQGVMLVMPHLGNFDLLGQALGRITSPIQVLSLPNPPAGFQVLNEVRRRSGVDVTPLTPAALRKALRVLRDGGVVGTGGDRPISELDEPIPFFGRPARMPSGHIRLALKASVPVAVACCTFAAETQRYSLYLEPPFELERRADRVEELQVNMRLVLDRLEAVIRRWPEQWQIFVPVWPELVTTGR